MITKTRFEHRGFGFNRAPPEPEPAKLQTWLCKVLEPAVWREVDPLQAPACVLFAAGTAPLEVCVGDVVAARFEATDAVAEGPGYSISLEVYELLTEQHGHEDNGETSPHYEAQGAAAVREALPPREMLAAPMRVWREEPEARLRMAEARGRWYGMSPEAIEAVTGRPYVARRSLLPPMGRARVLDEQGRAAEAQARQGAAAAQAAEEAQPKTVREHGIAGVATRRDRLGATAEEPFAGARLLWTTEAENVFGWRALAAMHLPVFDRDGVRSLDADELVPPVAKQAPLPDWAPNMNVAPGAQRALVPDWPAIHFLQARRSEAGLLDFGPVPTEGAATEAPSVARELARTWAAAVLAPAIPTMWRIDWLTEVLIRSELHLRPDVACACILAAMDAEFARQHKPFRTPGMSSGAARANEQFAKYEHVDFTALSGAPAAAATASVEHKGYKPEQLPSHTCRANISARCVQAAERGEYVAAGEPLGQPGTHTATVSQRLGGLSQHAEAHVQTPKNQAPSK